MQVLVRVRDFINAELFELGGRPVSLMTVLIVIIILVVSIVLSRVARAAIRRAFRLRGIEAGAGLGALGRLVHYAILAVGLGIGLQTAGIKLSALFAAGAIFAVGIGFAMQNIAQNFVSGVILLVERSIKPGDVIELQDHVVRVSEMGIRSTLVRTLDGEDLIVPNSTLVQSVMRNYTLHEPIYRVRVVVGVTYSSDMKRVREVLEAVANGLDWRQRDPAPQVLLVDFGSSSVDWEVGVWIASPFEHRIFRSKLREAIWFAFQREGIVIAFPQLDVHFDPVVESSLQGLSRAA